MNAVIADLHHVTHQFCEEGRKHYGMMISIGLRRSARQVQTDYRVRWWPQRSKRKWNVFVRMKVCDVVSKNEVDSVVIGSRWVITNKGTRDKPRSKNGGILFVGTHSVSHRLPLSLSHLWHLHLARGQQEQYRREAGRRTVRLRSFVVRRIVLCETFFNCAVQQRC